MSRQEIMLSRYGEMLDMISCLYIYEKGATPKAKKQKLSFDEAISLR